MYLLLIFEEYDYNEKKFHIFTTRELAEQWIEEYYVYRIVPDYKIIDLGEYDINPTRYDSPNDLDLIL